MLTAELMQAVALLHQHSLNTFHQDSVQLEGPLRYWGSFLVVVPLSRR